MVRPSSMIILLPSLVSAYAPELNMNINQGANSRRGFFSNGVAFTLGTASASFIKGTPGIEPANAVGPVKIKIVNPTYSAGKHRTYFF